MIKYLYNSSRILYNPPSSPSALLPLSVTFLGISSSGSYASRSPSPSEETGIESDCNSVWFVSARLTKATKNIDKSKILIKNYYY